MNDQAKQHDTSYMYETKTSGNAVAPGGEARELPECCGQAPHAADCPDCFLSGVQFLWGGPGWNESPSFWYEDNKPRLWKALKAYAAQRGEQDARRIALGEEELRQIREILGKNITPIDSLKDKTRTYAEMAQALIEHVGEKLARAEAEVARLESDLEQRCVEHAELEASRAEVAHLEAEVARLQQENDDVQKALDMAAKSQFELAVKLAKRDADLAAKAQQAAEAIDEVYQKTSLRGMYCTTPTQKERSAAIIRHAFAL